ncbi:MAG: PaaI family thioesterase, partial [Mycobacteriales bacterium]
RLADELRRIINRMVLVRPPAEDLRQAADTAREFADRLDGLRARLSDGEVSEAGLAPHDHVRHSPLSGTSNPLAPPMRMWTVGTDELGHPLTEGSVRFGAAYEGPPAHVHGGFVAAMFDELLGRSQGQPGFTAYLTVTYRRPTPLFRDLQLKAWVESLDGRKRVIKGTCHLDGVLLTEAEGLFLAPRGGSALEHLKASLAQHSPAAPTA